MSPIYWIAMKTHIEKIPTKLFEIGVGWMKTTVGIFRKCAFKYV